MSSHLDKKPKSRKDWEQFAVFVIIILGIIAGIGIGYQNGFLKGEMHVLCKLKGVEC